MHDGINDVIEALYAGTAEPADVYEALGWRIVPHRCWTGGIARQDREGKLSGVPRVTRNAHHALHLIDHDRVEEAVRAAMELNRPLARPKRGFGNCPIARRICIIALTRPDLRSRYAEP